MDSREAREILALYRPGSTDAADPLMAEALEQVPRDPELAEWFEQHNAVHHAIRAKLKSVPIPAALKRQIILESANASRVTPFPAAAKVVLAAAAVVVLCVSGWFLFNRQPNTRAFAAYRERMAGLVQRSFNYMQFNATNQADILEFYRKQDAPTNFVLSTSLQQLPGEGGSVLPYDGHKVDMLCLDAGAPGTKNDLWVFVINRSDLENAPPAKPEFLPVARLMTASWTAGDKIYLLVAAGTEKDLAKFLE